MCSYLFYKRELFGFSMVFHPSNKLQLPPFHRLDVLLFIDVRGSYFYCGGADGVGARGICGDYYLEVSE